MGADAGRDGVLGGDLPAAAQADVGVRLRPRVDARGLDLDCGGRLKKFRVTADGGHVVVTKTNFMIALAPYFFPFYAVLVVGAFVAARLFWNWQPYTVWFHLLLGAAYAFHRDA